MDGIKPPGYDTNFPNALAAGAGRCTRNAGLRNTRRRKTDVPFYLSRFPARGSIKLLKTRFRGVQPRANVLNSKHVVRGVRGAPPFGASAIGPNP